MLIRLPDFVLADHPAKEAILTAIEARNAAGLRATLTDAADKMSNAILLSLALHFEGDAAGCGRGLAALGSLSANADWRAAAMLVGGACALERLELSAGLKTLNAIYELAPALSVANRRTLLDLLTEYTTAVGALAGAEAPRLRAAQKLRRTGPVSYVISYPRSGNTMSLNALSYVFQTAWHSVFPGDGRYFCRELCDPNDTSVLLVKDHVYKSEYFKDRAVFIVRDGRDAMVSMCRFLEVVNDWRITDANGFVDFLVAAAKQYQFGFWADNVRLAVEAQEAGADIEIWRYEDLISDPGEYLRLAAHIAPDRIVVSDASSVAFHIEQQRRTLDGPQWGYTSSPPQPALFEAWSRNRGGSNWRTVFNARARRAFHELGGTDMLLRFGYETDADWWRYGGPFAEIGTSTGA